MHREEILFFLSLIAVALIFMLCPSCKTIEQVATISKQDSIRTIVRTDSVYIWERDSVYIKEKADTVFITAERWRYRDKIILQSDTVVVSKIDSICTITEVNRLTKAQHNMIVGFWVVLAMLIAFIGLAVWRICVTIKYH